MARKKTVKTEFTEVTTQATEEVAIELANAFDEFTMDKYGMLNPPNPYITPTGIKPLDALLGGGLASSMPIAISSTPETGKSTLAFQFAKQFLEHHPNGLAVYFDIEANASEMETNDSITIFQESRAETFNLDSNPRFKYNRRPYNIKDFFEYLDGLIEKKRSLQVKTGSEIKLLFIVDSITALSYSRLEAIEEFDKIPGRRAAELSFYLTKWKQNFAYDRITMITIDQLKAALSLKSQYEQADEKTIGIWKNTKAATGVYTYMHMVGQWLFCSKGTEITPAKFPGWKIDGWIIDITTEKNKNVSSKHTISVVFDKRNGIDRFWSEFLFLSDYCPSEKKLIKNGVDVDTPLCIKTEGAYSKLEVINPITGELEYTSKSFYKKNAKDLYLEDEEFRKWFDLAVDYSCKERISKALLKINMEKFDSVEEMEEMNEEVEIVDETINVEPAAQKRRGRKKKDDGIAPSSNDQMIEESVVLEE